MGLEQVLKSLRELESAGIIRRFAIGGAVGATFYLEPAATLDVDVFVAFHDDRPQALVDLGPIYSYLTNRGAKIQEEHLVLGGWPVQFLPASSLLLQEAIAEAQEFEVEGVTTRAFSAEHLAAIALDTGRAKDKARLVQFVESNAIEESRFMSIVSRHDLTQKWQLFNSQFFGGV